jgi:hypothetical protein
MRGEIELGISMQTGPDFKYNFDGAIAVFV